MKIILYFFTAFASIQEEVIDKVYNEVINYTSIPDFSINTSEEAIHVVIITKDYIFIKFFEFQVELKTELIAIKARNTTLYNLQEKLVGFKGRLSKKTLIVNTSLATSTITPKDVEAVFSKGYEKVITGYYILNGPRMYRESNCVGLILCPDGLSIQFHKYDRNIMNIYILPVNEESFIHKIVCNFLVDHKSIFFTDKKFTSDFVLQSSLYRFLFNYIYHLKQFQGFNSFISINKHSVTLTISRKPLRAMKLTETCFEFFDNKNDFVIKNSNRRRGAWTEIFSFLETIEKLKVNSVHSITFLYEIIRSDNAAFLFLLTNIVNNENPLYGSIITVILFLLGLHKREDLKCILEGSITLCDRAKLDLASSIFVSELMNFDFPKNSPLFLVFKYLIVEAACQEIENLGKEGIVKFKKFEFIQKLCDIFTFSDKKNVFLNCSKKQYSLFSKFFFKVDPLHNLVDIIFYVLYAFNKFVLKNDKFFFYSNCFVGYTADAETVISELFRSYLTMNKD